MQRCVDDSRDFELRSTGAHGTGRPDAHVSGDRDNRRRRRGCATRRYASRDLSTSDFELRDNAVLQRIEAISIVAVPIDVTLVVDVSNSTSGQIAAYQRDVSAIAASLRSIDRLRVLSFESVVREVVPLTPADGAVAVARLETGRLSSVYDGVAAALLRQSEPGKRHLIIAYTDGGENRSILTGNQLLDLAKTADAVLNVVTPRALPEIVELDSKPCNPSSAPGGLLKTDTVYDPVKGRMVNALGVRIPW